jgi:hypothetical protein
LGILLLAPSGLHAEIGQHIDKQRRHFADAFVLRANAWMTDVRHQPLDEAVSVGLDMREDGGKAVVGRYHAGNS